MADDESTEVIVTIRGGVDCERLYGAEDTADQDEGRCAIKHDADCSHVGREHAVSDASSVDQHHQTGEDDLDYTLQDERDADQRAAGDGFGWILDRRGCIIGSACSCETLDGNSKVDEDDHDSAGM